MPHQTQMIEIKVADVWLVLDISQVKAVEFTDKGARQYTVAIMYYGEEGTLDINVKLDVEDCKHIAQCLKPTNKPRKFWPAWLTFKR